MKSINYGNEIPEDCYFQVTKKLYEKKNLAHLSVNILPSLLEEIKDELEKVILIATLQEPIHSQDSYFAAMIIQEILQNNYPDINFEVFPLRKPVIDNQGLISFYVNFLKPFQGTSKKIIITDAGGSTQQRIALKLAAEYVLSTEQLEVYSIAAKGTKPKIEKLPSLEYRNILEKETIKLLLIRAEIKSAWIILKNIDPKHPATDFLLFLYYRTQLDFEKAQKIAVEKKEKIAIFYPFIQNYIYQIPEGNYADFSNLLTEQNFFILYQIASTLQYYYLNQEYTQAVALWYLLILKYPSFIIKKTFNYDSQDPRDQEKIKKAIQNSRVRLTCSLPLLLNLHLCQEIEPQNLAHQSTIRAFLETLSSNDRSYKAHLLEVHQQIQNGKVLHYEELTKEVHFFEKSINTIFRLWGLPSPNFYMAAIQELCTKLA
ncbi:MAG: hypothetical protein NZ576_07135 [Bacteroidia bacterium]|nr:hypothetical protein [Bacteroidia bacterium]